MGRHSRKGRGNPRDTAGIRTAHGAPQPESYGDEPYGSPYAEPYDPGSGHTGHAGYDAHEEAAARGRRGPGGRVSGHEYGYGQATPPGGIPQAREAADAREVRGGHPEQREPGGGWGAQPWRGGAGATAAGPVVGAVAPGRQQGGPRQEYLDAFDDDVFAAGAPGHRRPGHAEAAAPAAAPETTQGSGTGAPPAGEGAPPATEPEGEPEAAEAPEGDRRRAGGKGRTITGVAAAAVTTVLAVVIAGHVADGRKNGAEDTRTAAEGDQAGGAGRHEDGAGTAPRSKPLSYDDKMARAFPVGRTAEGSGDFRTVSGHQKGPKGKQVLKYRVDVEKGLDLQGGLFAQAVQKTLNDKRSWAHGGERSFERVSSGKPDFVITLASPKTTDVWCAKSGLDTSEQNVSCDSAATERVMINGYRWAEGAATYGKDRMHQYRQMLINHEVGHRLGHNHVGCAKQGELAPVMMQQTKYLSTDGRKCRPNAWPYP
ncbi:DUF3152 domain-containing protein [Streptomyces sp. ODS28]|uniref:DUF3152 domain-containing protein n=1 Tax=Streptomyces sp. ODS28 TaxID=3136688 RepID=UPI0031EB29BE